MITRAEVDARSFLWPDRTVPYQQWGTASPTGDRPDCSGYVGGCCWNIPVPVNTVSLVTDGWMYEIAPAELLPSDAIGKCGPGTAGNNGHIMLFRGWTRAGLNVAEQNGDGPGPVHHTIKRIPVGYKAYRFRDIVDDLPAPPTQEDDDMKAWLAQDDTGIVVVWTGAGDILYRNIAHIEAVAAWNAAGVPGPFIVPSIAALGSAAPVAVGPGGPVDVHVDHVHDITVPTLKAVTGPARTTS